MYNDDMLVSRTEVEFTHRNLDSFVNKVIVLLSTFLDQQHVKTGKIQPGEKQRKKRKNPGHIKTRLDQVMCDV